MFLPLETWREILDYLDVESSFIVRPVCKNFRDFVDVKHVFIHHNKYNDREWCIVRSLLFQRSVYSYWEICRSTKVGTIHTRSINADILGHQLRHIDGTLVSPKIRIHEWITGTCIIVKNSKPIMNPEWWPYENVDGILTNVKYYVIFEGLEPDTDYKVHCKIFKYKTRQCIDQFLAPWFTHPKNNPSLLEIFNKSRWDYKLLPIPPNAYFTTQNKLSIDPRKVDRLKYGIKYEMHDPDEVLTCINLLFD